MKINFRKKFVALLFFSFLSVASVVYASDLTSTNFIIRDPIIGTFGNYGTSASFQLISSGHTTFSSPGGTSASFMTRYGFLYFDDDAEQFITFDLDTDISDTESGAPYSVALGTLSTSAVARSNNSTINSIWMDLDTNAPDGAVITVVSSNGAIESTSVPADTIPSASTTMAAGTANYGLCVASNTAGVGTFDDVSPFDGATCVDGAVNNVGALTTSPQNILDTNDAPIATGRAEVRVNAAISGVIPAHTDYTDTLTFIVTGTF